MVRFFLTVLIAMHSFLFQAFVMHSFYLMTMLSDIDSFEVKDMLRYQPDL